MLHHAYGQQLARALHGEDPQSFVSHKSLLNAAIAVTEVRREVATNELTSPEPYDDAFIVALNVRSWAKRILWIDDKPAPAQPLEAGMSTIFDLRRKYIGYGVSPFHLISFYLPRRALDRIAELEEMKPSREFGHDPCVGVDDPTIQALGLSLSEAFKRPNEANALFVDHVTTALAAHVLGNYGLGWKGHHARPRRLAPWQEQRAKELMASRLDGKISLAELAGECRLPVSTFRRAFTATVGLPPHQWLMQCRLARAMNLMRASARPLAEIAKECGFTDERHLARVFICLTDTTPQEWRRTVLC